MALFLSLCLFIFLMSSASHLHQYTNTALDNTAKELSLPISNWYFLIKYCPFLFSYQNRPAALIQLTALLWNTLFFLWPWYHTFLFFTHWFQPSFSVSLLWDFFLSFQYWCSLGGPMPSLFVLHRFPEHEYYICTNNSLPSLEDARIYCSYPGFPSELCPCGLTACETSPLG